MNWRQKILTLAMTAVVVAGAVPASAHHSFAMFDKTKEVTLSGTVSAFQWSNPHTFIQLKVPAEGRVVEWSLEGGSPNILSRNGWNRLALTPGEKVTILINPLRNGQPGGTFLEVRKANGTVLYYHG